MCKLWSANNKISKKGKKIAAYLCWRKLSGRLKCFPHTSHEKAISGLLCVRSWIIKLYDFVNRRWQYLHTYSHFGRILRRKSSLSIFNTVNILKMGGEVTTLVFFFIVLFVCCFTISTSGQYCLGVDCFLFSFHFWTFFFVCRFFLRDNCIYFSDICGHAEFN